MCCKKEPCKPGKIAHELNCAVRKPDVAYAKTKAQITCAVTAQLISAFVFATQIICFLFSLNTKFQASSLFLWLYRPVCVGVGQKKNKDLFSRVRAQFKSEKSSSSWLFTSTTLYEEPNVCLKDTTHMYGLYSYYQRNSIK